MARQYVVHDEELRGGLVATGGRAVVEELQERGVTDASVAVTIVVPTEHDVLLGPCIPRGVRTAEMRQGEGFRR
eukprot:9764037-Alexandrium_andersonii.AAC.1